MNTDAVSQNCLAQTRNAVVNVMIAVAITIALSGLALRWRDRGAALRASEGLRRALLGSLFGLAVASYTARRVGLTRSALRDPDRRAARFYRGHLLAAAIGALAAPLGLVYGWLVQPRLDAVSPFWVAALALGLLALPRACELEGFDEPMSEPGEPRP